MFRGFIESDLHEKIRSNGRYLRLLFITHGILEVIYYKHNEEMCVENIFEYNKINFSYIIWVSVFNQKVMTDTIAVAGLKKFCITRKSSSVRDIKDYII